MKNYLNQSQILISQCGKKYNLEINKTLTKYTKQILESQKINFKDDTNYYYINFMSEDETLDPFVIYLGTQTEDEERQLYFPHIYFVGNKGDYNIVQTQYAYIDQNIIDSVNYVEGSSIEGYTGPSWYEITSEDGKAFTLTSVDFDTKLKNIPIEISSIHKCYYDETSNTIKQSSLQSCKQSDLFDLIKTVTEEIPVEEPITNIDFDIVSGLQEGNENVASGSLIATLKTVGGTAPFTYSFNTDSSAGKDNGLFTIEGDKIKVGTTALTAGNFKISVKVEDVNNKTFINSTVITVAEAVKPEITGLNIDIVSGLQEGDENVAANAIVGSFSTTGGTAPFTYTLGPSITGKDNSSFVVEGDKLKVGSTALTAKNYTVSIVVTDKNKKTLEEVAMVLVDAAAGA